MGRKPKKKSEEKKMDEMNFIFDNFENSLENDPIINTPIEEPVTLIEESPIEATIEITENAPLEGSINEQIEKEFKEYYVKVTHPCLRIRKAPSLSGEIIDFIYDMGIYKILDEVNGWGKIGEDRWIMLSYTKII